MRFAALLLLGTAVLAAPPVLAEPDVAFLGGEQVAQAAQRRRPGEAPPGPVPTKPPSVNPYAVEPPRAVVDPSEYVLPIPDRWRLVDNLGVKDNWLDPYNQNTLKGDRPIFDDYFIVLAAISDTVYEPRAFPLPIVPNGSNRPDSNSQFGDPDSWIFNQNLILSASLIKGNTAFKPPDIELRLTPVLNYNYARLEEVGLLNADPTRGETRSDGHIGLQEAFLDYHLGNVSDRYDFISIRAGIQPFSSDFRGFLFQDNQLGVRLFGNWENNFYQYNLAWFRRMEKDTNSGLNDVAEELRDDDIFLANLYLQDVPRIGLTSQFTFVHNRNRENKFGLDQEGFNKLFYNDNNLIERPQQIGDGRPRHYDVSYLGYNVDGHWDRLNLTGSFYYAFGKDKHDQFTSTFESNEADIRAFFAAVEPSIDFDWIRVRGSALYASGDSDPYDGRHEGFDAIFENPQFAGADTSYWIRQGIPLIGGGQNTALTQRNGVLSSLRTSKEHGQSNFVNPGLTLLGAGADFDVLPELRISTNLNHLRWNDTSSLSALRMQGNGAGDTIDETIGWDLSAAAIYRPTFIQNIVFRLSGAVLFAGDGMKQMYGTNDGDRDRFYSVLANLVLTY